MIDFARSASTSFGHAVGTAKIGTDAARSGRSAELEKIFEKKGSCSSQRVPAPAPRSQNPEFFAAPFRN